MPIRRRVASRVRGRAVSVGLTLSLAALVLACARERGEGVPAPAGPPPNFVVVFADDLGWGDLAAYGHPTIRTPHLDRLAAEGQRWTSFYVADSVCSPSRAALLTGRLPVRSGLYGVRRRVLFPGFAGGMPDAEVTLAEALRDRGYATAIAGKWHLGDRPEHLPTRHGFDTWLGTPYSNDMLWTVADAAARRAAYREPEIEYWDLPLYRDEAIVERPAQQPTLTRRYTEEAIRFVRQQRDRPFFVYLAHGMPHLPLFPSPDFVGHSQAGVYGDVIEEIDWSVGAIVAALEEEGLAERTLLFFTSDNGPWTLFRERGGSAGPLRDGKGTTFEGGMRVPGIFWWPGKVAPAVVGGIGSTLDVWPTFVRLAGYETPADLTLDGFDLSSTLLQGAPSPRREMPFYRGDRLYALRRDSYKIHFVTEGEYGLGPPRTEHAPPLLYHLGEDSGERWELAADRPQIVADLAARAAELEASLTPAAPIFDR